MEEQDLTTLRKPYKIQQELIRLTGLNFNLDIIEQARIIHAHNQQAIYTANRENKRQMKQALKLTVPY